MLKIGGLFIGFDSQRRHRINVNPDKRGFFTEEPSLPVAQNVGARPRHRLRALDILAQTQPTYHSLIKAYFKATCALYITVIGRCSSFTILYSRCTSSALSLVSSCRLVQVIQLFFCILHSAFFRLKDIMASRPTVKYTQVYTTEIFTCRHNTLP